MVIILNVMYLYIVPNKIYILHIFDRRDNNKYYGEVTKDNIEYFKRKKSSLFVMYFLFLHKLSKLVIKL